MYVGLCTAYIKHLRTVNNQKLQTFVSCGSSFFANRVTEKNVQKV